MADAYRVGRVAVAAEPLVPPDHDYADAFELRLDQPDTHTAEEWVRAGLDGSGSAVRATIRFVHARVARFALREDGILGWEVVASTPDVLHLRTEGPLLRAEIVARRTSPTTATASTFLHYKHRVTPLLWRGIGPVHRRVAPLLLRRAAARFAADEVAAR